MPCRSRAHLGTSPSERFPLERPATSTGSSDVYLERFEATEVFGLSGLSAFWGLVEVVLDEFGGVWCRVRVSLVEVLESLVGFGVVWWRFKGRVWCCSWMFDWCSFC